MVFQNCAAFGVVCGPLLISEVRMQTQTLPEQPKLPIFDRRALEFQKLVHFSQAQAFRHSDAPQALHRRFSSENADKDLFFRGHVKLLFYKPYPQAAARRAKKA